MEARNAKPSTPAGEIVTLKIERLGDQGDGVAPEPAYVPLTLAGEVVNVRLEQERGELVEIVVASSERVAAPCPHFGQCGGCALQHWSARPYLDWKCGRIADALAREGMATEIIAPYAAAPGSRRRLTLHARRHGGRLILGLKAKRSWRVVDLETCVIAQPVLVSALPALRALCAPLLEHPKSAPAVHVTVSDTGLDIEISGVERRAGGLSAGARARVAQAAARGDFARVTLAGEILYHSRQPRISIGGVAVDLPAGAFLQATPGAEAAMAAFVVGAAAGARNVADLYCGVGAFTFPLATHANLMSVDASAPAISALAAATAGKLGLRSIATQVRDLDRRPLLARELKGFDAVIFDPPRAGAAAQCVQLAASTVAMVIGVSCNPTTFARDARILADGGYALTRVLPVDQFLWSPHIELVGIFSRRGDDHG